MFLRIRSLDNGGLERAAMVLLEDDEVLEDWPSRDQRRDPYKGPEGFFWGGGD